MQLLQTMRSRRSTGLISRNPSLRSKRAVALACSGRSHTKYHCSLIEAAFALSSLSPLAHALSSPGTSSSAFRMRSSASLSLDITGTADDRRHAHFSWTETDQIAAKRLISDHSAGVA